MTATSDLILAEQENLSLVLWISTAIYFYLGTRIINVETFMQSKTYAKFSFERFATEWK